MTLQLKLAGVYKTTELLVSGYLRQHEISLSQIIPPLVVHICLMFHWIPEYFDIISKYVKVSDDKLRIKLISKTTKNQNTTFGAMRIPSTDTRIYLWTFKILHKKGDDIIIGISNGSNNNQPFHFRDRGKQTFNYGYCGNFKVVNTAFKIYGDDFKENDILKMILDLKKKTLSFMINDKDQGIAFENIKYSPDIYYKMAVSFEGLTDEIQLINFENKID